MIAFFLLLYLFSIIANAANCHYHKNIYAQDISISFDNKIVVNPTLPVGSIITRTLTTAIPANNQQVLVVCQSAPKHQWETTHQYPISSLTNSNEMIYQTELAGIGLKIINHNNYYGSMPVPWILPNISPCDNLANGKGFCGKEFGNIEIQLIKTASEVTAGYIPSQTLVQSTIDNLPIIRYQLSNTQIFVPKPTCKLDSKNLTVNLGKIKRNQFKGLNSTAGEKTFTIHSKCSASPSVAFRIEGESVSDTIIALKKSSEAAEGVGLQLVLTSYQGEELLRFSTPLQFGETKEQNYALPFTARYIQIADKIKPGKADATITIRFSYD